MEEENYRSIIIDIFYKDQIQITNENIKTSEYSVYMAANQTQEQKELGIANFTIDTSREKNLLTEDQNREYDYQDHKSYDLPMEKIEKALQKFLQQIQYDFDLSIKNELAEPPVIQENDNLTLI